MKVKKYSGELVEFEPSSLRRSLQKSGANEQEVDDVYQQIAQELFEGIPTQVVYEKAFQLLKEKRAVYAAKYSLKKALRDLGPAGYYFETWVCQLMKSLGFQAMNGQMLAGYAVPHEIDVLAMNETEFYIAECKLRNDVDAKISVTTPMYFLSRINDLKGKNFHYFDQNRTITKGWLITNAYFTKDALEFGTYYGIQMLSWDFPKDHSIKNLTDEGGLYPITCLTCLSEQQIKQLLNQRIILVQNLLDQQELVKSILLKEEIFTPVFQEAQELLNTK